MSLADDGEDGLADEEVLEPAAEDGALLAVQVALDLTQLRVL